MQQVFFDRQKLIFIKVFSDSNILEREVCGAKIFSKFIGTPKIEIVDNRVAKIDCVDGFLGYQINEEELNLFIAKLLESILPIKNVKRFTIFDELERLKFLLNDQVSIKMLDNIEKNINRVKLFPVHGDLQKLNVVISQGELFLIDFEHFIFAPRELEIVNSIFFNDGNCLEIEKILEFLPSNFFDRKLLKLMLEFYCLKQISLGMDRKISFNLLEKGLERIDSLNIKTKAISRVENRKTYCYI